MPKLAPADMTAFIYEQLDRVALAHSTFTEDALSLIVRSSEGVLRRAKNLCLSALLEAVRDRTKTVDLKHDGSVGIPRKSYDPNLARVCDLKTAANNSVWLVAAEQDAFPCEPHFLEDTVPALTQ